MQPETHIIYRPERKGAQRHGVVKDTILQDGNTRYLVLREAQFMEIVKPEEIEVIEGLVNRD